MADKTISQLPQLPGNLTLDTILAVVQNGVAHKAEVGEVVDFTLGNIKVVENANGTSVRIPGARLQVCWHRVRYEHDGNNRNLQGSWTFPQAFNGDPIIPSPGAPTSSSRFSSGLNLNALGHPFFA